MSADLTLKRQEVARETIAAVKQLRNAQKACEALLEMRQKLGGDFQDADFTGVADLAHLTAGTIGSFFDFTVPAYTTTYLDEGNGGRNIQNICQVLGD